jgi:hypothetical protein
MENRDALAELVFNNTKIHELLSSTVEIAVTKAFENYFPKKAEPEPEYISMQDAMRLLDRSRAVIFRLCKEGKLTRHYINGLSPRSALFSKAQVLGLITAVQFKYRNKNQ